MTEDHAAEIVRRIVESPSREAFDCASGAIVRLFARVLDLEKRIAVIERGAGRTRIGLRVGLHVETAGRAGAGDFSR